MPEPLTPALQWGHWKQLKLKTETETEELNWSKLHINRYLLTKTTSVIRPLDHLIIVVMSSPTNMAKVYTHNVIKYQSINQSVST